MIGNIIAATAEATTASNTWDANHAFYTGVSVLAFGVFVMICITIVVLKQSREDRDVVKLFGLPLIIIAAVYLVVTGYDEKQIAPVIALLSSVGGFILGSSRSTGSSP